MNTVMPWVFILTPITLVIVLSLRQLFVLRRTPNPLDHPDVEWEVKAESQVYGPQYYTWRVAVGNKFKGGSAVSEEFAIGYARNAASILLSDVNNQGRIVGRSNPCVICERPSRIGKPTCGVDCEYILDRAQRELG